MARIRDRDTQPELAVRRAMHAAGLRYRLHRKGLPGRPDLVFPSRQTALFVHGCFWHCHAGCSRTAAPATRQDYWLPKLARNVERDKENQAALQALGWTVLVAWECDVRRPSFVRELVERVQTIRKVARPGKVPSRSASIHDTSDTDGADPWPSGPRLF